MSTGHNKPDPRPLNELMEKELPPETGEQSYRRGYRDGWIQAIEVFSDLVQDYHLARVDAHYITYDHWSSYLYDWEQKAKENREAGFEIPPEITAEQRKLSPAIKRFIRGG